MLFFWTAKSRLDRVKKSIDTVNRPKFFYREAFSQRFIKSAVGRLGVTMDITISEEAYEKYRGKKDIISNIRLRPDNQDFFDALLSVDMTATPEGRDILDAIRKLS